ncbi:hypothetical protein Y032_0062g3305 [Ancylostoma ceylanicum]|uniref:Uncharacterized protein n=1 Tax=Ancylostoma ceylanicum TaxID=53326 RepID=A0A016U1Q7_9BILA|nr:hypothetical protein Y032_0062g3305 [Ancylostoma ceylanicum]
MEHLWTTLISHNLLLLFLRGTLRTCASIDIEHEKLPISISQPLIADGEIFIYEIKKAKLAEERVLLLALNRSFNLYSRTHIWKESNCKDLNQSNSDRYVRL